MRDETSPDDRVDYGTLAEFRWTLRKFQTFSETAAAAVGLSPQQHQAMLAVMGFGGRNGLAVGALAERLLVRHNTAAELVNRLEAAGLARRGPDKEDGRGTSVVLTSEGKRRLRRLSHAHLIELKSIQPAIGRIAALVEELESETR